MLVLGTVEGEIITGNLLDEMGHSQSLYHLNVGIFSTAQGGTLDIQSNGDFTYTPPSSFNGTDTFSYDVYETSSGMIQTIQNAQVAVVADTSSQSNVAQGSMADDIFLGSQTYSVYEGGDGTDTISYSSATEGVVVDQTRNLATNDGFGERDTLLDIENVSGSSFNDVIVSSAADNTVEGAGGADKLYGMAGADVVRGGSENDIIYGDWKTENAQDGADTLYGGTGNDIVYAGGGDDIVYSDEGNDRLYGGTGIDTISYQNASAGVVADLNKQDAIDGQGGRDTLSSFENAEGSNFDDVIVGATSNNIINGYDGDDDIFGHLGDDVISGGNDNDTIYGDLKVEGATDGADTLNGDAGDDLIFGQGGADVINGGSDNDRAYGGDGDDTLNGGTGHDVLYGDFEVSQSGDGNDIINGEDGNDSLFGGIGTDTLDGGAGDDRIFAGADDDHIIYTVGRDVIDGGTGIDIIDASSSAVGVTIDLVSRYALDDNGERSELSNVENIIGSAHNDRLSGDDNANNITSGDGNDISYGGLGSDILSGGAGADVLYGDNAVAGSGAADTLYGDEGNDTLFGGDADDLLIGGTGADKLYGGDGVDTIDYSSESASVIVDMVGKWIAYTDSGNDLIYDVENVIGTDFDDRLIGNAGVNVLDGGAGADRIFGWYGVDTLYGGDGNDIIYGDWKSDTAEDGDDTIFAGAGDDLIIGNAGNDVLHGDAGNDTYIWDAGDTYHGGADFDIIYLRGSYAGAVHINEISGSGIEQIALDNFKGDGTVANTLTLTIEDLAGIANNNTIYITGDDGVDIVIADQIDTVTDLVGFVEFNGTLMEQFNVNGYDIIIQQGLLQGAATGDVIIGTDNAEVLNGTDNDNIILGKAGADTISGGLGADRIDGDDDGDTIYGDQGNDILIGGAGNDDIYGGADNDILYATDRPWYDTNWTHRQTVTIEADQVASDLTDFTIRLSGDDFGDDFWNTVQTDGRDILVTDSTGSIIYDTEVVSFDVATRSMQFYINVDSISSVNNTTLNVYYGNAGAVQSTDSAWNSNYTGVWHLDDDYSGGIGSTVADSSQGGNDGEVFQNFTGVDEVIDARLGKGLDFNNTEYIAIDHSYAANTYVPEVSVTAWVNTTYAGTAYNQNWGILDFDRSEFFNVYVDGATGQLGFSTNSDGNNGIHDMSGGPAINDGQWHHIAAVYDGADKILYVDGVEVARVTNPHNGAGLGSNLTRYGIIADGSESDTYNEGRNSTYFDGQLDEIKLYEGTLSADEIAAEFNNIENGSDFYSVSATADIYTGGADDDNLYGGDGDDTLYASSGNDTLNGDANNDLLYGGSGSNALYGGTGADQIYADSVASGETTNVGGSLTDTIAAHNPDGYWRLNETSGSVSTNLGAGSTSIDGTIFGAPTMGAAALYEGGDTSIQFDGVNDYIEIPDSSLINTVNVSQRTVELVFNADVTSGRHVLYEEGGASNALSIYIDQGEIYFQVYDKGDFGPFSIKTAVNVGETYHAAIVFDSVGGNVSGYVNGQLVGSNAVTKALAKHTGDIGIGAQNNSNYYHDGGDNAALDHFFQGRISDVALYNDALSQEDIQSHYDSLTGDLPGSAGAIDDVLYGGDGLDQLFGGEGRDVFVFEASSAFNDVDLINNFSVSHFDSLDISDLLSGWVTGDPVQGDINNFVQLTELGGNTVVSVDADGSANGSSFADVAQINNVTGIDADLLYNNDMLIVE